MIIREKGKKTRYYYYKKKRGRKRKPGPKPKKKIKPRKVLKFDYKIITTSLQKQNGYIGKYHTLKDAVAALKELEKKNEEIVFPVKTINYKKLIDANFEYLLLKKIRETNKDEINKAPKFRNEYGKLIENIIDSTDKWVIYDKAPMLVEETFWVYGYSPKLDRKTFLWVFENFIVNNTLNKQDFLKIYVFYNKIVIKKDNNDIEMVICKSIPDAIHFYNLLEEYIKKNKLHKQILFLGSCKSRSDLWKGVYDDISKKTGWNYTKILRNSTRA